MKIVPNLFIKRYVFVKPFVQVVKRENFTLSYHIGIKPNKYVRHTNYLSTLKYFKNVSQSDIVSKNMYYKIYIIYYASVVVLLFLWALYLMESGSRKLHDKNK